MVDDAAVSAEGPGLAVVTLRGEVDAYRASHLEEQLESIFDRGASVVVDLSGATFVDSVTLLALLKARAAAEERGFGFVLLMEESTGYYVLRIFELTRLTSVFTIFRNRADALDAARAAAASIAEPRTETA
jgi:anti-anti-sigma factor